MSTNFYCVTYYFQYRRHTKIVLLQSVVIHMILLCNNRSEQKKLSKKISLDYETNKCVGLLRTNRATTKIFCIWGRLRFCRPLCMLLRRSMYRWPNCPPSFGPNSGCLIFIKPWPAYLQCKISMWCHVTFSGNRKATVSRYFLNVLWSFP